MKYVVFITLLICVNGTLLMAEPSVYANHNGAFSSPSKAIGKNKKTIMALKRKIIQQGERIDGLRSIVEGLSATVHELQKNVQTQSGSTSSDTLLKELGTMIDKINSDYVSKEELQKALSGIKGLSSTKTKTHKASNSIKEKNVKKLYSEGVRLFLKKRYNEAKKRFAIADTKGYKPAASNYYLGEISYYTKQYEDAIFYFKKSAGLHEQASYIDTLLLHTAVSLEKSGKKEQAKAFYENIIVNYAGKKSASIAKEKLKKL